MTSAANVLETNCSICGKQLVGKHCNWDLYKQHLGEYSNFVEGYQCQACGASYCGTGHKKELQFSLWTGYEKSNCSKCGQPLSSGWVLLGESVTIAEQLPVETAPEVPSAVAAQVECPACGAEDVSITRARKGQIITKILLLAVGAALFASASLLEWPIENPQIEPVLRLIGMLFSAWIIWDALTGRPLPFTGLRLTKEEMKYRAECGECGHQWTSPTLKA